MDSTLITGKTSTAKPGLVVPTDHGHCVLLYPERPGHPEGNWVGVFADGYTEVLTQDEIAGKGQG